MNSCIHAGLRWLIRSGIQDESGGVARYYRADDREYKTISTATTGYFISALLRLQWSTGEPPPPAAIRAGYFLIEHAFDPASELFFFERGDNADPRASLAYFFDCGLIVRSLLDLWKATSDRAYLECAEKCGLAMSTKMSVVDGSFFPLYDVSANHPHSGSGTWSVEPGVYQLKVGLAFLELAEATGLGQFKSAMESLLKWSLRRQESFLGGDDDDSHRVMDRAHAYCYFLEGLLPEVALDRDCNQALQFGILRVENLLTEIGAEFQRCDVIAQLLRLRIFADLFGVMELSRGRADQEANAIIEYQMQSSDPKVDGGFAFAKRNGEIVPHVNPATTIFAVQALKMWEQAEEGSFRQSWKTLI